MLKKVEAYIRENQMIEKGDKVLAAVSGGADSVCLLHILVSLRKILGCEICAVHVHHGLRGAEADGDAEYVRELSDMWEVPCLVVYEDVAGYASRRGIGVEEAGRELRYLAFEREARGRGAQKIAVAHHQDDQAETILHNLFRGSGIKGLAGMAPVRGKIIRPLLAVTRREILEYLGQRGIAGHADSTNASMDYTRNRMRHKVIPVICREINLAAVEHIASAGELLSQADRYFNQEARRLWLGNRRQGEKPGQWGIEAQVLSELPQILKGYTVMEMLRETVGQQKDMASVHVEGILDLAEKGTGRTLSLPCGLRARKEYSMVWLEKAEEEKKGQGEVEEDLFSSPLFTAECVPAGILRKKYKEIPEKKYTKWFDYDKIKGTLSVRTRRPGDYFTLKDGKKKTVKAFMIDEKIPREDRDRILLVTEGQHVLWIVGCRISEFYKITDDTKQILQVMMDGGEEHDR